MVKKINAKAVLGLRAEGLSGRAISASQGISRNSIADVIEAADRFGSGWDELAQRSEDEVYALLFPGRGEHQSVFVQPDWNQVHRQLARVGVTLKLLHGEYQDACAASRQPAMGYDRFCKSYQRHVLVAGAASRAGHKAGVSVEVDWSGPTMRLDDPVTGSRRTVYLFVACLPFSRYAFVAPTLDMKQDSWLRVHVAMFEFMGGSVPRIVSDNLKTGVISHPREGEIVLNDAYRELAGHYGAAVLPARVKRAKDKPSVENTVGHVATWVIASLREHSFTTLDQLRLAIGERIEAYNREPFQKRSGSRLGVFTSEEKPLLRTLPAVTYEISRWIQGRRVGRNSYVSWQRNFYSVPFIHIGARVDLRVGESVLEVYRDHQRLTSHRLQSAGTINQYRTNDADLPEDRRWREWDGARVKAWAARIGSGTVTVIERIFESVAIEEQGLDAALAVLRLSRRYSPSRVEAACQLALRGNVRSPRYAHLRPILETRQDQMRTPPQDPGEPSGYVRGASYYAGGNR